MAYVRDEDYRPDDRPGGDSVRSAILKIASGESDPGSSALDDVYAHLNEIDARLGGSGDTDVPTNAQMEAFAFEQALPGQSGNSGKFVKTDGADASWENIQTSDVVGLDSALSDLETAIETAGVNFTASGAVTAGNPAVINDDDTVSEVSYTGVVGGARTPAEYDVDGTLNELDSCYDPVNNCLIVYVRDYYNSTYGRKLIKGTFSDGVLTFGSAVDFSSIISARCKIACDELNGHTIAFYLDNAGSGLNVCSINNQTMQIVDSVLVTANQPQTAGIECCYVGGGKVFCVARTYTGSAYVVQHFVVTNDGESLSVSAVNTLTGVITIPSGCAYDTANSAIVINGNFKARVGVFSGGVFVFGSEVTTTIAGPMCYEPTSGKIVLVGQDASNNRVAAVGTVSGSSITFGSVASFSSDTNGAKYGACIDVFSGKVIAACVDVVTDEAILSVGTVSGTSISFESPVTFNSSTPDAIAPSVVFDSEANMTVLCAQNKAVYFAPVDTLETDADNYIGIFKQSAIDGAEVSVAVQYAVDDNQTGLTRDQGYWLDYDGSLSTSDLGYPKAGTAISTTQLLVGV